MENMYLFCKWHDSHVCTAGDPYIFTSGEGIKRNLRNTHRRAHINIHTYTRIITYIHAHAYTQTLPTAF